MGRRTFKSKNTSKAKKEAIKQYRKTRAQIEAQHPDLLSSIQEKLAQQGQPQPSKKPDEKAEEKPQERAQDEIPINREKNMKSVMQSLVLRPGSKAFQAGLKKVLMDVKDGAGH